MTGEVRRIWKWVDERAANVQGALHPELARRVMTHRAERARDEARKQHRKADLSTTSEDTALCRRAELLAWAKADRWSQHLAGVLRPLYTAPGATLPCGHESTQHAND